MELIQKITGCGWPGWCLIAAVLFAALYLLVLLKRFLARLLFSFFERHHLLNDAVKRKLNCHAAVLSVLLPASFISGGMWLRGVQANGEVVNTMQSSLICLAFQLALLFALSRINVFFGRCYAQSASGVQRPVRGIVIAVNCVLLLLAITEIAALITHQRPLILLSSIGAVAAIFMFAFQNTLMSLVANVQINSCKLVQIGDWISIENSHINGIVEQITSHILKVRNWDMSTATFPVRLLLDESFVNYQSIFASGAREIKRALWVDQRTVRFLTPEETQNLREIGLFTDAMEKRAEKFGDLPLPEAATKEKLWSNIELFNLYAEEYLSQRSDIRHDRYCMVRPLAPTSQGIPLEVYCYTSQTLWMDFEKVQSSILYHLLTVLPSFRLRVFQDCSDVYQEVGNLPDTVGSSFRFDHYQNPVYPDNSPKA